MQLTQRQSDDRCASSTHFTSRPDGSDFDGLHADDDGDDCDEYGGIASSTATDYDRTSARTSDFDWGRRGSALGVRTCRAGC